MEEQKSKSLSTEQKAALADRINKLIDKTYPEAAFYGQEEVLLLALYARTSSHFMSQLLRGEL